STDAPARDARPCGHEFNVGLPGMFQVASAGATLGVPASSAPSIAGHDRTTGHALATHERYLGLAAFGSPTRPRAVGARTDTCASHVEQRFGTTIHLGR